MIILYITDDYVYKLQQSREQQALKQELKSTPKRLNLPSMFHI
jgi:hypothetical protein